MIERIREFFSQIPWHNLGEMSWDVVGNLVAWGLIVVGFIGTFLQVMPGSILILAGALVHRFWLGAEHSLSWVALGILGLLVLLSYLVDNLASAMGAKWYGASSWGVWGAVLGGVVGIFFGIPGLFLGPLVGAFAFELLVARKHVGGATRSTWGTLVGTMLGILARGGISLAMIVTIVIDLWK